jgi:hypothetical protein
LIYSSCAGSSIHQQPTKFCFCGQHSSLNNSSGSSLTLLVDSGSNGTYTVIIDALDECSDPFELVEGLKLITQSSKNLQIFFSSRLQDYITPEFPSASIVEIDQKGDRGDIRTFIEQECRERREVIRHRFRGPEEMTDDLAETLQKLLNDRAGSM